MYWDNEHVRVNLSELAQKILKQDTIIFGSGKKLTDNGFINLIVKSFLENHSEFSFFKLNPQLIEKNRTLMIRPNKEVRRNLKNLYQATENGLELPDWYRPYKDDITPNHLFKAIIESYAELSMLERERVVLKDTFDFINSGIKDRKRLRIQILHSPDSFLEITPYKIVPAKDGPYSYLICFLNELGSDCKFKPKVIRISRIIPISHLPRKGFPKSDQLKDVDALIAEFGPTFLLEEPVEIKIRFLSERALVKYQYSILHRPIHDSIENDAFGRPLVYTFHCSEKQATYFFFRMAGLIQIIEPLDLRMKFKKMYMDGIRAIDEGVLGDEDQD